MRVRAIHFCSWVTGCAFCFLQFAASAYSAVLTFDESPPATYRVIENGYGGLGWNNFDLMNATNPASPSHLSYLQGMVSSPDVAFNLAGNPCSITSLSNLFSLNSAYFTSVFESSLQIRVRGYTEST